MYALTRTKLGVTASTYSYETKTENRIVNRPTRAW